MAEAAASFISTPKEEMKSQHLIDIYPPLPPPPPPRPGNPSTHLITENARKEYFKICLPLYEAALKGDWGAAKDVIAQCSGVVSFSITKHWDTALHIASSTEHTQFVEELVKLMEPEELELKNKNGNTALCLAAAAGNVKIAKVMVDKRGTLPTIRGSNGMSPLYMAALFGHSGMVSYLYSKTHDLKDDDWTDKDRISLFYTCVNTNLYDVAFKILDHHLKVVAVARDMNALHVLARKPSAFAEASQPIIGRIINSILPMRVGPVEKKSPALKLAGKIWQEVMQLKDDEIWDVIRGPPEIIKVKEKESPSAGGPLETVKSKENQSHPTRQIEIYPSRLLFVATELGNHKFLIELIRSCPELIWKIDDNYRTIFHVAVLHRQESVYNLLYEIGSIKDLVTSYSDTDGNTILHLAGMKPTQNRLNIVSGVALQMQRELMWFKEVESMVDPSFREKKNKQGKTPRALFTEEHAGLVKDGEGWLKNTAAQCMVVAALITTVMFAAAFTVPGGISGDSGNPIFLKKNAYMVYVITDAISLVTSSASILVFLAIITARYAEQDFLQSLPLKLMMGLFTLFISITTMMVAFGASFFLVYKNGMKWVPILVAILACIPAILFVRLQYRLFFDVIRSTFGSRFLFKPKKRMLYQQTSIRTVAAKKIN